MQKCTIHNFVLLPNRRGVTRLPHSGSIQHKARGYRLHLPVFIVKYPLYSHDVTDYTTINIQKQKKQREYHLHGHTERRAQQPPGGPPERAAGSAAPPPAGGTGRAAGAAGRAAPHTPSLQHNTFFPTIHVRRKRPLEEDDSNTCGNRTFRSTRRGGGEISDSALNILKPVERGIFQLLLK